MSVPPAHRPLARPAAAGVTLIELMVVVVIVGILAAIAYPSYRRYIQRADRTEATAALLRLASNQERYYLQNHSFAGNIPALNMAPLTASGYYRLEITAGDTQGFTAIAVPADGSPQRDDSACQRFAIDAQGARSSAPQSVNVCWR